MFSLLTKDDPNQTQEVPRRKKKGTKIKTHKIRLSGNNVISEVSKYRILASTSSSCLEAFASFFRLSVKGKFDVYFTVTF